MYLKHHSSRRLVLLLGGDSEGEAWGLVCVDSPPSKENDSIDGDAKDLLVVGVLSRHNIDCPLRIHRYLKQITILY